MNKINKVIKESNLEFEEKFSKEWNFRHVVNADSIKSFISQRDQKILSAIEEEVKALKTCPDCKGSGETECGVDDCDKKGIHRCFRCYATGSVDIDFHAIQAILKSAKEQIK